MNFKVTGKDLKAALHTVKPLVDLTRYADQHRRSVWFVTDLEHVYLCALHPITGDLARVVLVTATCSGVTHGIGVDYRSLSKFVHSTNMWVEFDEQSNIFTQGARTVSLETMGCESSLCKVLLATIPQNGVHDVPIKRLSWEELAHVLLHSCVATAKEDNRPILEYVLFQVKDGLCSVIAADGWRLHCFEWNTTSEPMAILVHWQHLDIFAKRIADETGYLSFSYDHEFAYLQTSTTLIKSRLYDGTFPDVKTELSGYREFCGKGSVQNFRDIVTHIEQVKIDSNGVAICRASKDESELVMVGTQDGTLINHRWKLAIDYSSDIRDHRPQIRLNFSFLVAAIATLGNEAEYLLWTRDPNEPCCIEGHFGDVHILNFVMPIADSTNPDTKWRASMRALQNEALVYLAESDLEAIGLSSVQLNTALWPEYRDTLKRKVDHAMDQQLNDNPDYLNAKVARLAKGRRNGF
jgi:DNA polymerase III sliding clamp (beta) subunit (PCNA family)